MIRIAVIDRGMESQARTFQQAAVRIGRDPNNDLVVAERYVSARHGEIRCLAGGAVYQGRATTNPTLLRRGRQLMPIDERCDYHIRLEDGDELFFGDEAQAVHLLIRLSADPPDKPAPSSGDTEENIEVRTSFDVTSKGVVERLASSFDREALIALHKHATGINTKDDEPALLANFAAAVFGLFHSIDQVSVYLWNADTSEFAPLYSRGRSGETQAQALSRTVKSRVLAQREALTFAVTEPGFDLSDSLKASNVRAGMCVPMWNGEQIIGLVQVNRRSRISYFFNRSDLEVLVVFTKQLVLSLENAHLHSGLLDTVVHLEQTQSEMERLAFFDPLTGLGNRRLIRDRIRQAIKIAQRSQRSVALLYLDLDQFKQINDSLGHESGDRLLLTVANRLQSCVRDQDTVARIGGDEFVILLTDVNGAYGTRIVANKILEALRQPIPLAGGSIVVTTSVGVAVAPEDGSDEQVLLRNADLAMYRAKKSGRDNCQFFTEGMNHEATDRLQIETQLRTGMAEAQFQLHFQPILGLRDQRVVGLEALLRWQHPERGLLLPDEFIDIAEDTGLIVPLGEWVLKTACHNAKALQLAGVGNLRVAINLSARQFLHAGLPKLVAHCLHTTGLEPQFLEIEITESMVMENTGESAARLRELKTLGVSLSIDDFGTGYSSLSYLKRFPIGTLKVDRSFVRGIPDDPTNIAICAAVIAMAHKLKLTVVAEGIETQEQLAFLRENSCDFGQGYLFSEALSLRRLLRWLRARGQ